MSFFRKIITRHDTGLGEAYMDDDFDVRTMAVHLAHPNMWLSYIPSFQCHHSAIQEQDSEVKTDTF